ncbi:unnamed protein product, partial [Prorocentrum cordatum]
GGPPGARAAAEQRACRRRPGPAGPARAGRGGAGRVVQSQVPRPALHGRGIPAACRRQHAPAR